MTDRQDPDTSRPDAARMGPGGRQDAAPEGLTVAEAAARLAVTPDAIRRRLHRGTLAGAKTVDGEWRVWLPVDEAGAPPGPPPGQRQDAARTPPGGAPGQVDPPSEASRPEATHPAVEALIESQQAEIAYLREQLAERSRELAAERERFDVLHREALARIPALGAGQDSSRAAPSPRPEAPPAEASPDTAPPWWKFWERWR
ncbi:MAG: helix-turn-helix domain-containing protein [Chloroflexota bacterium]|nr:helix-turn-helix domain-containing protein [Chloroflexota bacterium]